MAVHPLQFLDAVVDTVSVSTETVIAEEPETSKDEIDSPTVSERLKYLGYRE